MNLINNIAKLPEYKNICDSYSMSDDESDELYQELMLTLMEYKNQDKLQELFDKGELLFFAVGIVRNMACSSTSAYHRKIRGFSASTCDIDSQYGDLTKKPEDTVLDTEVEDVEMLLDKLYNDLYEVKQYLGTKDSRNSYYKRELFDLYFFQNKTFRGIQDDTGILHVSIYKTIKTTLDRMAVDMNLEPFKLGVL